MKSHPFCHSMSFLMAVALSLDGFAGVRGQLLFVSGQRLLKFVKSKSDTKTKNKFVAQVRRQKQSLAQHRRQLQLELPVPDPLSSYYRDLDDDIFPPDGSIPNIPIPTNPPATPAPTPPTPRPTLGRVFQPSPPTQRTPTAPTTPFTYRPTFRMPRPPVAPPSPRPTTPRPTTPKPSTMPSFAPSTVPTVAPTGAPSAPTSELPSKFPSAAPVATPSKGPSKSPSDYPSGEPSVKPSFPPSIAPTYPSGEPSVKPSFPPSISPTYPSGEPSGKPSFRPSNVPTIPATSAQTLKPTALPSAKPSQSPSSILSSSPSQEPSLSRSSGLDFTASPTIEPTSSRTEMVTDAETTLSPTFYVAKAAEATSAPTNAESRSPTSDVAEATLLPTAANDTSYPTTTFLESYRANSIAVGELTDLDIILESTLEFSLWFPEYRASQLNLDVAENGVLNSLEAFFCRRDGSAALTMDSPDNLCVLHNKLIGSDVAAIVKSPRQGKDHEDPDVSIVRAPHVDYLDERYAYHEDRRYYWTTWKVSFEIFQLGRPVLQRTVAALGTDSVSSNEDIFRAGAATIQDEMKRALDMSLRNGVFDSLLSSYFTVIDVFSSPVEEELATFGVIDWNYTTVVPENSIIDSEVSSTGIGEMAMIAAIGIMSVLLLVSIGAYISLRRSRSREVWKSQREKDLMRGGYNTVHSEPPVRRPTPDTASAPGEVSTITNTKGSLVPAEIDLIDSASLPTSLPVSKMDDGGESLMSSPSMFIRHFFSEGVGVGDREEDLESRVSSSVDLAWSMSGVDMPWRPAPSIASASQKAPRSK